MRFKVKNSFEYEGERYRKGDTVEIPAEEVETYQTLGFIGPPVRRKKKKAVKEGETR